MPLGAEPPAFRPCIPASWPAQPTRLALCLGLALLAGGCASQLTTKTEDASRTPDLGLKTDAATGPTVAPPPNPLFAEHYAEDAEIPFVMQTESTTADGSGRVRFGEESASRRTREMAEWVIGSKDNRDLPFAIVDKINAKVYVFGIDGTLQGAAPVLLGLGIGDEAAPDAADLRMGLIPPEKRTTPAGRFEAMLGRNAHGKEILWVDYANSISMHPVVTNNPSERRLERLTTPTPLDNRISFGCINVPTEFFKKVVHNQFSGGNGIVYVLPETKRVRVSQSEPRDSATGMAN